MTRLDQAKRLVVKIGSALLVNSNGQLNRPWLTSLIDDLARLKAAGVETLIVSSGAIALGRRTLGLPRRPLKLAESQAAASVGQIALARAYQQILAEHGYVAAQILLTLHDTEERRRYLNARSTIATLLKQGAVPVINENDTVATSEIRYGDNDRLAARVSSMVSADCLVLLSDVDGLYTAAPGSDSDATLIPEVHEITPAIMAMAGKPVSGVGSGGMITKIEAARIAVGAGAHMVIASGRHMNPLRRIDDGAPCTWFLAKASPVASRKRWIAGALEPAGRLIVDDGAANALLDGRSLLPAGVKRVEGSFARGDTVSICTLSGSEIARGLVAYDRVDAERIVGARSHEIEERIGWRGRDEMVHRDDLVIIGSFHHEAG
ncbi:glutamate 5-kinase [Rhodoligotrophos ferricapiens]|uniref:glutamate 5-kinase n=1 Tax=Rhodoligotrophos ferricapiens TaxID=3069264 RepID=UPI00315DE5A4